MSATSPGIRAGRRASAVWLLLAAIALTVFAARSAPAAIVVAPGFASDYSFVSLGSATNVPVSYGGLTFKDGDPNTLLLGGAANGTAGAIYAVPVTRDPVNHHVTGFAGPGTLVSPATGNGTGGIDGGLTYGPGGVLFYTSYADNTIGQIKPGSSAPDKKTTLTGLGVASSVGSLAFVPDGLGFATAGHMKVLSYNASTWYDTTVSPDGTGTYTINTAGPGIGLSGGIEGAIYIAAGNKLFPANSILVSEYSAGRISAYQADANGDPITASRQDFITGLSGAEGAAIDPVTGDFFFSTFGGGNQIIEVNGFLAPEPTALCFIGLAAVAVLRRRSR